MSYAVWNPLTTYLVGDTVSYLGVIYGAILVNTNVIPLGHPLTWVVLGGGGGGGGSGTGNMTFLETGTALIGQHYKSAGVSGNECVKSSMLEDSVSITFGALNLAQIGTMTADTIVKTGGLSNEFLMADGSIQTGALGGGNMNYVGSGTNTGQHYTAFDTTGLNATNSALVEDADKVNFNGERIYLPSPLSPYVNGDYAIKVEGFTNNVGDQNGLWLQKTHSDVNDCQAIYINDVRANNNAYGGAFIDIGAKQLAYGLLLNTIRSDIAGSFGVSAIDVISDAGFATGYSVDTVQSTAQRVIGFDGSRIKTGNGEAYGMRLIDIASNAGGASYGTFVSDIFSNDGKAFGSEIQRVTSNGEESYGIKISAIKSNVTNSNGILIYDVGDNIVNNKIANGVLVSRITGGNGPSDYATGFNCDHISSTVATGLNCLKLFGTAGAYGSFMIDVQSDKDAVGYYCESVTGGDTCEGLYCQVLQAKNICNGIKMIDIISTDSEAHCAYFDTITAKGDCIGLLLSTLTSSNGNCFGDLYKGITSNTSDAFGMCMTSINGKTTHALYAEDVIGGSASYGVELVNIKSTGGEARGISMSPVTARTNGFGINIQNVTSESANSWGSYTDNISSNGGFAQGSEIAKVTGLQGSYGLNIHDVNCEAKDSYGIRVDSVNAPSANAYGCILTNIGGSRQYGFYQRGALNVGNIFDAFVDCGGSTGLTDPPALNVRGSTNTKVQFFTTATATATVNGGNIIICSGGVITTLNLPSSPPDGLTYQLWKPSTPTLTINGVTHLINGSATQSIATGSPTNPQNISLTYSSALGQWLYHIN